MKIKNLIGIILILTIFALIFLLLSQESSKKVVIEDKNEQIKIDKSKISNNLSEEERIVEDLKKQAGSNLENSVSRYYIVHCSSCHGKVGEGTMVAPIIKGKSYDYIVSRLDDYKNDRVVNSLMKGLLTNTSDEDLKILAKEIANFK